MNSIFAGDIPSRSFLGLIRAQEQEVERIRQLKPLHTLINAGLAALLVSIAIAGFATLNEARTENNRIGMSRKQMNDQVVVCSLDNCRMTEVMDA
ncbi:hypothetical protein [Emcibacter sp.]|uniref:hypothetical protein n=1 Tax=Emcibacter sp. TaxID=1979954 RepID=UPI003A936C70